jgi:hypothetical protein
MHSGRFRLVKSVMLGWKFRWPVGWVTLPSMHAWLNLAQGCGPLEDLYISIGRLHWVAPLPRSITFESLPQS